MLRATEPNSIARETGSPNFVHPCCTARLTSAVHALLIPYRVVAQLQLLHLHMIIHKKYIKGVRTT